MRRFRAAEYPFEDEADAIRIAQNDDLLFPVPDLPFQSKSGYIWAVDGPGLCTYLINRAQFIPASFDR